jgi:hypothetical protein
VTPSFNTAGWVFVSKIILAVPARATNRPTCISVLYLRRHGILRGNRQEAIEPKHNRNERNYALCAAISTASALGSPIRTAPSANASTIIATKAGPDPARAVHTLKCFSSTKRTRPHDEKIAVRREEVDDGDVEGIVVITVIPWPICTS